MSSGVYWTAVFGVLWGWCPQPICMAVAVAAVRVCVPARSRRSAPVCPVLSHACERARPCAPVRSHPSPRGPWRSLRRPRVPLPVRSHGWRGVPAAPRKPWEASFGSIAGAGICLHHPTFLFAPIQLHPGPICESVGHSRALVAQSPTRAAARPGPPERLPLPAASRAGPSSPGAGVTQPVCPLLPLSQPVRSSSSSSCLHPLKSPFYAAIYIILVVLLKEL